MTTPSRSLRSITKKMFSLCAPDGKLGRRLHVNILVQNVRYSPSSRHVSSSELQIDPLPSVMHVAVLEGDVVHDTVADGTNGQSYTTGRDTLEQHVLRVVLR